MMTRRWQVRLSRVALSVATGTQPDELKDLQPASRLIAREEFER